MQGEISSSFKFGLDLDKDIYYTKEKYTNQEEGRDLITCMMAKSEEYVNE